MSKKYRLQYWDSQNSVLSISWAWDRENYIAGDCRVRAIKESTDIEKHNKINHQTQNYTKSMTLNESRAHIVKNSKILGSQIHDCIGLILEDVCEKVEFDETIQIRNH